MKKRTARKLLRVFDIAVIFALVFQPVSAPLFLSPSRALGEETVATEPAPSEEAESAPKVPETDPVEKPVADVIPTVEESVASPEPVETPSEPSVPTVEADGPAFDEKSEPETPKRSVWRDNGDGSMTIAVEKGETYEFKDTGVKITFTKLPDNPGDVTVREVKLSESQVRELGALSDTAWDITSTMENGTFEYDLVLPVKTDVDADAIDVNYAENEEDLSDGSKVKDVDETQVTVKKDRVEVENLDHFTVFLVSATLGTVSVPGSVMVTINGQTHVDADPGATVTATVTVGNSGTGSTNDWESTSYRIDGGSWKCVNHADHTENGIFSESFAIIVPITPGDHVIDFRAHRNDDACSNSAVDSAMKSVTVTVKTVDNPALSAACGLDIALVLDASGSISGSELSQMKDAMKGFVDALSGTPTQFSVTKFNATATVIQPFTGNFGQVKNVIDGIGSTSGNTNWEDALVKARSTFDPRADKPDLIIFASDGNPNTVDNGAGVGESEAVRQAVLVANQIKSDDGIRILSIGIGSDLDLNNLTLVSGLTVNAGSIADSDVITTDFSGMAGKLAAFAAETCGGTITINKYIDDLQTPAGSGWKFSVGGEPVVTDSNGQTVAVDVRSGTYNVFETDMPSGYHFGSASCKKNGGDPIGTPSGSGVTGIFVGDDDIITCDFINLEYRQSLTLVKNVVNNDGGTASVSDFTLKADDAVFVSGVAQEVAAGTYSLSESGPPGYSAGEWECSGADEWDGATGSVTIRGGESVVCTIVNDDQSAHLTLTKKIQDDYLGGATSSDFILKADDAVFVSGVTQSVDAGIYTLSESGPDGYEAGEWSCVGEGELVGSELTLSPGESARCEITNTAKPATLKVCKFDDENGNGAHEEDEGMLADWTMTVTKGVEIVRQGMTRTGGCVVFDDLTAGSYTVSETSKEGWTNTKPLSQPVTLTLGGYEEIFFGNQRLGSIVVHKDVRGPDGQDIVDTSKEFAIAISGAVNDTKSIRDGEEIAWNGLVVGAYTIAEAAIPTGYELVSITPDGDAQSAGAQVTVTPGSTKHVYVVNRQLPAKIVVKKETVPEGEEQSFEFTLSEVPEGEQSQPQWERFSLSDGQSHESVLLPGTYAVSESVPEGWELTSAICDSQDPVDGITLTAGETVTCTFTNTKEVKKGMITVEKWVNDKSDQLFSFLTNYAEGFILARGDVHTSGPLDPGYYSVKESDLYGWDLTGLSCVDRAGVSTIAVDKSGMTAGIDLAAGGDVYCTFTNKDTKRDDDPWGDGGGNGGNGGGTTPTAFVPTVTAAIAPTSGASEVTVGGEVPETEGEVAGALEEETCTGGWPLWAWVLLIIAFLGVFNLKRVVRKPFVQRWGLAIQAGSLALALVIWYVFDVCREYWPAVPIIIVATSIASLFLLRVRKEEERA